MSLLSMWKLELSLYTHGPLVRLMKFQLSVCRQSATEATADPTRSGAEIGSDKRDQRLGPAQQGEHHQPRAHGAHPHAWTRYSLASQ